MDTPIRQLVLDAEREAQMFSAFARLAITTIALLIFIVAGGIRLPVAPVVLTYLGSYVLVSVASAIFSLKRFFNPWFSLFFTAIDGISLALLIGFALQITGSSMSLHGAVPGYVFIFSILILASMRYTIGPTLVAFFSFTVTWFLFAWFANNGYLAYPAPPGAVSDSRFFFGTVQNSARWGFVVIATILCLLAVVRRRKTLEAALRAANRTANLSRYLPDRVARLVAQQGMDALSLGRKQNATVLFADIRGFTRLSEAMTPEETGKLVGEFRSIVSSEVEANDGIIDKFIGDAVMAVFGVPEERQDDADSGIRCALGIKLRLETWNETRQEARLPPIKVTIGVHCGEVFAGAVGSENRMEYTVLGDTVNVAARLQEAAKKTASGVVVSQMLMERASAPASDRHEWTKIPESAIRGRQGKILLFVLAD